MVWEGGGGKVEERFVAYITTLEVIFLVLLFFSSNASYFPFFFYICFVRQCGFYLRVTNETAGEGEKKERKTIACSILIFCGF